MQRQYLLPTLNDHEYMVLPESIGLYWDESKHQVDRKVGTLNNFSIHFIVSGSGFVEMDGKQYSLKRGDAFLYFPMQEQRYYSSQNDPWNIRWVHFYGSVLHPFLSDKGFHQHSLWKVQHIQPLEELHEQLLLEAEKNSFLHLSRLSTLTYTFLMEFITNVVPRTSERKQELDDRIQSLLPLMQSNACEPFELDYWAEQAGVSTYYFCRLFKRATQMTPMAFITLCRLQMSKRWLLDNKEMTIKEIALKAGYPSITLCRLQMSKRWLLDNKEMTIKEIALKAGYPSISYFNKRFLQHEGMTPTDYRQLYPFKTKK